MYETTLEQLIVLISGAVAIAIVSYILGLSNGIDKERRLNERNFMDKR